MPTKRSPRHGSMAYWPRKKAKRSHPRIRTWTETGEVKPLGFAGYKVGMTHVITSEKNKIGPRKGDIDIAIPVTVIECPPLKVGGIRIYKDVEGVKQPYTEIWSSKLDKEIARTIKLSKNKDSKKIDSYEREIESLSDVILLVYTQPKLTGIGKKKPEIFELAIGGSVKDKFEYAKSMLGQEINVSDIFKEGLQVDVHSVSKGKGYQGPVKRFGVAVRQHKSEKTKRGPGSVGPWHPHHGNYRVAHAGQMGFFTRTDRNKKIVKISADAKEINNDGGFLHYGLVKNNYILLKGSLPGTTKRLIKFIFSERVNKKINEKPLNILEINTSSKQGN